MLDLRWQVLGFFLGVLTCQQLPKLPPLLWGLLCFSTLLLFLLLNLRTSQRCAEPVEVPCAEPVEVPCAEPVEVPCAEPVEVPCAEPVEVPCAEPVEVRHTGLVKALLWLLCFVLGLSWAAWRGEMRLAQALPAHLQQQVVQIQGEISSLPDFSKHNVRFIFQVKSLSFQGQSYPTPGRIRLSWYFPPATEPPPLRPGQRWQFSASLKRPHGTVNPGGFDYESWLFQQGIRALGTVRSKPAPQLLASTPAYPWQWVQNGRFAVQQAQRAHFAAHPHYGLLSALSVGTTSDLSAAQWRLFRATGTNHLMAISGLHVGMISLLVFLLTHFAYRHLPGRYRGGRYLLSVPAFYPAAGLALLAALGYAALAGFSIPTQRALVMLLVLSVSRLLHHHLRLSHSFALALGAVLWLDPTAVLSVGFWLSFGAVGALLYAFSGHTPPAVSRRKLWALFWESPSVPVFKRWLYLWLGRISQIMISPQFVVFVALIPLLLGTFGQVPLLSIVANALAIPLLSWGILPPLLLGSLMLLWLPTLGVWLLQLSLYLIDWLMAWLAFCQQAPLALWSQATPPTWALLLASIGALLLLLPRAFPGRWLGFLWLLPALLYAPPRPPEGAFRLTLLDVDQGLAAVVQTHRHTLLYDSGTAFFGSAVVVPYLRSQGIKQLDVSLVSHDDGDHIGGAEAVLHSVPVERILSNARQSFAAQPERLFPCLRGQHWQWDGVLFEILHPRPQDLPNNGGKLHNNASCVLKVSRLTPPYSSLLLPGDIEKAAEIALSMEMEDKLPAEVLVVPHHGSRSSSLQSFVEKVKPRYALLPVGYLNRYQHPHPLIVQRYQQAQIRLLSTAQEGAISLDFNATGVTEPESARAHQRYWHDDVKLLK